MNLRLLRVFLSLVAFLAVFLMPEVSAQTSGASLVGKVVDADGAALPGVTITATNSATGITRSAVTGSDGSFRFPALPIGTYNVSAGLSGFGSVNVQDVQLNVATERSLEVTLRPAALQESITITAEAPLIATSPSVGTIVSQQELENLPLNGRQFANLGVLAPGTTLAYNSDPTKPGQLTVALNGGIGRNVNYVVDGGDNMDDTIGGALQNFNLEAVQEFNIQTMQYKAEFGRSSGGVLSVVTKTGTNRFGGSLVAFFRDDSLNSKTESEKQAGIDKQPYERESWGGSFGGPIIRDRAHFFATYEKTDRTTEYVIDTRPSANAAPIFPEFQGQSVSLPFADELITAKGTVDLTPRQFLQVRYGYQKNSDKYGASPLALPDSLGTVANKYESGLGGHSWQLGSDSLNEFVIQWTRFDNVISADSDNPYIYFPSGVHQGQNVNTPQSTHQEKTQFKDDFSWSATMMDRRHDWKAGVNYIHEPILGGDFSTGLAGQYSRLRDEPDSPITDITIYGGFFGDRTPVDQYSVYIQDDLSVSDRLTLNLGIRYDFWDTYEFLDQGSNPILQALSTQTTYNEYYLQPFKGWDGQLENDDDNWGPRLGFSWDMSGEGRRILRGGWGIYYDFPYTNATVLFPAAAVQADYGVVYNNNSATGIRNPDGTFFQPGQPLPPNQLQGADVFPPNEVANPNLATPYSSQMSLGYSWQVNDWLGLNFEAVDIQYRDIPYRFRANVRLDAQGHAMSSTRFPQFGNFRIWMGDGEADYTGFNIGGRARLASRLEMQGFYTYSEATGNILAGADEFRITDAGYQPEVRNFRDASVDPLNPLCDACFGPLNTDAKHRVTLSTVYRAPWDVNVSGILRYRSATPYTRFNRDLVDLDGDRFRQDLEPGVEHVNDARGESFSQLDVRVSKDFRFATNYGLELIAEVFNLLNEENPAVFNRFGEPSTYAGDPGQGEQQLIQLGARVRF